MKIVVSADVCNKRFRREFPCPRNDFTLLPEPPSAVYAYINSVLQENKMSDFVVHVAFQHEYSVPDLFDRFDCEEFDKKLIEVI